jgi:hypothetical protein
MGRRSRWRALSERLGDAADRLEEYAWQLMPNRKSRWLLDLMATGMREAGTLEAAQQRFYDASGSISTRSAAAR